MEIKTKVDGDTTIITVTGVIISIDDSSKIKEEIIKQEAAYPGNNVELVIEDSYLIPSSLIGALLKMIHENKIPISVLTKNEQLYYLIQRLKLTELLRVREI